MSREYITKTLAVKVEQGERDMRTLRFVGSDPTMDRHGESIDQSKWMLDEYRKNPVFLMMHDHWSMPVGRTTNVEMQVIDGVPSLVFDVYFPTPEELSSAKEPPEAAHEPDHVYMAYRSKLMNATSVGFYRHDDGGLELLELSAVPIPANPNARIVSRGICPGCPHNKESVLQPFVRQREMRKHHEGVLTTNAVPGTIVDIDDIKISCNNGGAVDPKTEAQSWIEALKHGLKEVKEI